MWKNLNDFSSIDEIWAENRKCTVVKFKIAFINVL